VREQYGCVFIWHQPDGKQPQWELPDPFHKFPQFDTDPEAYYRPYPEFSRRVENEPVHPQIVAENGPPVLMRGHFTRFHVGGNGAVHGGVIPLFYDWHFGMVISAAGRPDSRTTYLHVDYRKITPTDQPLVSRAWIDSVDGRKAFVRATMTDADGNVLSEASGLMLKLLPHQP
jgi:acyl-coenzyme A thioesterase PaaI-like protein